MHVLKRRREFCEVLDKCKCLSITCSAQFLNSAATEGVWSENTSLHVLPDYLLKQLQIIVSYCHFSLLAPQERTQGAAAKSQAGWSYCSTWFLTNWFPIVFSVSDGLLDIILLCLFSCPCTNWNCVFALPGLVFLCTYIQNFDMLTRLSKSVCWGD